MATENVAKKVDEIDKKIAQLTAQKQQILARCKTQERKDRTRKLIIIGGIMDKAGIKTIKQAETLLQMIQDNQTFRKSIEKIQKIATESENVNLSNDS